VVLEGRIWGTRSGLLAGRFGLHEIILEWSDNGALLVVCHTFREDKEAGEIVSDLLNQDVELLDELT
jgi:hypothetical protein